MRTTLKTIATILVVICWCGSTMAYDSFSSALINATRWQDLEFVRMHNAAEGNFSLSARSLNAGDFTRSHLRFSDPASIASVKADVIIKAIDVQQNLNEDATAEARIQGFFYSTQSAPSGPTGDVWAVVRLSYDGTALKADWAVEVMDNDERTSATPLGSGDLAASGTVSLDTTYELELDYDASASQFRFAIYDDGGVVIGSAQYDFSNSMGPAYTPWLALSGIAYNDTAYIDTIVDDVYVKTGAASAYSLYDDFSTFNSANWRDLQVTRKIVDGKLALGVQSTGDRETYNLRFVGSPDFIQTRVAISSASDIPVGGVAHARINGYFFNDTKLPSQQTGSAGDVWAHIRINDSGNGLSASGYVGKSLSDDESQWEDIWSMSFDDFALVYDTSYTMTLEFTGTAFHFTLANDNESESHTYTLPAGTNVFDAYSSHRSLRARVYGDAGGGTLYATFDNVRTSPLADGWEMISGTVSKDDSPLCAMVLANGQYMFSCGDDLGSYQMDVPVDANDEITMQVFVSGLAPYRLTYDTVELDRDVVMAAADPASASPVVARSIATDASTPSGWTRITGSVQKEDGTPLCAMVLANGKYMFSCGAHDGVYDLTVPLDASGNVTHYVFVSGLQPYKAVFAP